MAPRHLALFLIALAACQGERAAPVPAAAEAPAPDPATTLSANADPWTVETLRRDAAQHRGPADGRGRVWIEREAGEPELARVGSKVRFTVVVEAGPDGIAERGSVRVRFPRTVGWSRAQIAAATQSGYVSARTPAPGVTLHPRMLEGGALFSFEVGDAPLPPGARVHVVYGAGAARATAGWSAERGDRVWVAVDGDGDGTASFLADPPAVDLAPGPAERLFAVCTSAARPGARVRLHATLLDGFGNPAEPTPGALALPDPPAGLEAPAAIALPANRPPVVSSEILVQRDGVYRVHVRGPRDLSARCNPLVVEADAEPILWGDLHGHSQLSDGVGSPEDFYRYARDVAGLDVAALTDHDHWGVPRFLDQPTGPWPEIERTAARFHAPGSFVTLLGYEWTSWLHGHRHVLYFEDTGRVRSSIDPLYETPAQLWDALRGERALTFAHHSAGDPIATNWAFAPDPVLEPLTEIVSIHGSSESDDTPRPVRAVIAGNTVRDVLARGYVLGFLGSGDSHDGHPGCTRDVKAGSCGLAAIVGAERTRESVLAALRGRRSYATNGPRIVLRTSLDGSPMGSTLSPGGSRRLRARVISVAPLSSVDLVRSGRVVERIPGEVRRDLTIERTLDDLRPGEYLYLRALQQDGGAAWSSPYFFR